MRLFDESSPFIISKAWGVIWVCDSLLSLAERLNQFFFLNILVKSLHLHWLVYTWHWPNRDIYSMKHNKLQLYLEFRTTFSCRQHYLGIMILLNAYKISWTFQHLKSLWTKLITDLFHAFLYPQFCMILKTAFWIIVTYYRQVRESGAHRVSKLAALANNGGSLRWSMVGCRKQAIVMYKLLTLTLILWELFTMQD